MLDLFESWENTKNIVQKDGKKWASFLLLKQGRETKKNPKKNKFKQWKEKQ